MINESIEIVAERDPLIVQETNLLTGAEIVETTAEIPVEIADAVDLVQETTLATAGDLVALVVLTVALLTAGDLPAEIADPRANADEETIGGMIGGTVATRKTTERPKSEQKSRQQTRAQVCLACPLSKRL